MKHCFKYLFIALFLFQGFNGQAQNKKAQKYIDKAIKAYNLGYVSDGISFLNESIQIDPSSAKTYFLRGNYYVELGNLILALNDYETAVKKDPLFYEAYSIRGAILVQMGNLEEGIKEISSAIALNNKVSEDHNNRGFAYMSLGNYEAAYPDLLRAVELDPKNLRARINLINLYGDVGDADAAISECYKVINLFPDNAEAYLVRGRWYNKLNNCSAALKDFNKAILLDPNFTEAYMARGLLKDNCLEDEQGSIDDYSKAIELDPENADAYFYRSSPLFDLERYEEVIVDCSIAIQKNPNHAKAYSMRGSAKGRLGMTQESLDDFEKSIHFWPEDSYAYIQLAISYLQLFEYEKAIATMELTLAIDSTNLKSIEQLSFCYFHQGNYNMAIEGFNRMLQIDSTEEAKGYFGRALSYDSLGRKDLACNDMHTLSRMGFPEPLEYVKKNCLEYIDSNVIAAEELFYKASEYFLVQNWYKMIEYLDQIIELDPNNKIYYYERGHAKRKLYKYDEAIDDFNKSIEVDSSFADPYGSIGYSLIKKGDEHGARKYLTMAVERDSMNPTYVQNLATLEFMTENWGIAVYYYLKTIELNPRHIDAMLALAQTYWNLSNPEKACETIQMAVDLGSRKAIKMQLEKCSN